MADAQETVEYLLESENYFKDKIPPFTRKGLHENKGRITGVRLNHNGQVQTVQYRRYRSTDSHYATLRLDGLTYIAMALPKGWKRGNTTYSHGGCRSWFVWQGPDQQFLGRRFQGPVAVSTSRSERYSDIGSDSMSRSRLSSSQSFIASSTSPLQRSLELSPPPSEMDSWSALSDHFPTSKAMIGLGKSEPAKSSAVSTRRTNRSSIGDLYAVRTSAPQNPWQTLTRQEEAAIWMRICVPEEEDRYRFQPMFLSSARPSSDNFGPVTHRSLFEKVTRVCILGNAQVQQLEVMIDERHILKVMETHDTLSLNQISFRIGREEEESWDLFVTCLKNHIEQRHSCDDWHLVILAHVVT